MNKADCGLPVNDGMPIVEHDKINSFSEYVQCRKIDTFTTGKLRLFFIVYEVASYFSLDSKTNIESNKKTVNKYEQKKKLQFNLLFLSKQK